MVGHATAEKFLTLLVSKQLTKLTVKNLLKIQPEQNCSNVCSCSLNNRFVAQKKSERSRTPQTKRARAMDMRMSTSDLAGQTRPPCSTQTLPLKRLHKARSFVSGKRQVDPVKITFPKQQASLQTLFSGQISVMQIFSSMNSANGSKAMFLI